MLARPQTHAPQQFQVSRGSAVRIGLLAGGALSLAFSGWMYLANRVSVFDRISVERNLAAAAIMGVLAFIPVLSFFREPASLLISSLISWSILTVTYWTLSMFFSALREWYSPFEVFMLGAVLYLIAATVSWIGRCIWKARSAHFEHPHHRAG
ncbi:MAG TPA: hypothetical protein VK818_22720 [Methylomirabilota bacterium]|jgi:hypothetical protein|nr:hypothetical protein [Methylomirabilota bacterium]